MSTGITISGLDDCLKWLDKCPENCLDVAKTAMRDAAKSTTRTLRSRMPSRFKHLAKYKITKLRDGNLNAGLGLFNGHQQQGHQTSNGTTIDDWFKAYWQNYGTLTKRDPTHKFVKGVRKAAKARRNNVGQPAKKFFEGAIEGYDKQFVQAFQASLEKNTDKLYKR